jgi:hypothetical protein
VHALYEYGSMPHALAEPERWAHLCGHHGAGYFAEDDLARCPGQVAYLTAADNCSGPLGSRGSWPSVKRVVSRRGLPTRCWWMLSLVCSKASGKTPSHAPCDRIPSHLSITKSVLSIVSFMMDKTWLY